MTTETRTPSLHVYMVNGELWAEGPSANGGRHKFVVDSLLDLKADLIDQTDRERKRLDRLNEERHRTVFTNVENVFGRSFARRTIGLTASTPAVLLAKLRREGFTESEIKEMQETHMLSGTQFWSTPKIERGREFDSKSAPSVRTKIKTKTKPNLALALDITNLD